MKIYTGFLPFCYPNVSQLIHSAIKFEKYNLYHMLNIHRDIDKNLQRVII
jgi:hypothetical protein